MEAAPEHLELFSIAVIVWNIPQRYWIDPGPQDTTFRKAESPNLPVIWFNGSRILVTLLSASMRCPVSCLTVLEGLGIREIFGHNGFTQKK